VYDPDKRVSECSSLLDDVGLRGHFEGQNRQ
jgi:hypothetical protein